MTLVSGLCLLIKTSEAQLHHVVLHIPDAANSPHYLLLHNYLKTRRKGQHMTPVYRISILSTLKPSSLADAQLVTLR